MMFNPLIRVETDFVKEDDTQFERKYERAMTKNLCTPIIPTQNSYYTHYN